MKGIATMRRAERSNPELPVGLSKYTLQENGMLGSGAFAKIFLCVDKESRKEVALKTMRRSSYRRRCLEYQINIELELTKLCSRHPNVITVLDTFDDGELVVICMPKCHTDLQKATQARKKEGQSSWGELGSLFLFRQLLSAVAYIHSKGVIHRDLKPENILLLIHGNANVNTNVRSRTRDVDQSHPSFLNTRSESGMLNTNSYGISQSSTSNCYPESQNGYDSQGYYDGPGHDVQLFVSDFGWSTVVSTGRALAGTYIYMSPEVLDGRRHSTKGDLWGCGMILYFTLFSQPLLDQGLIAPGVTNLTQQDPVRSAQIRARRVRERIQEVCPLKIEDRPSMVSWETWLLLRDLISIVPNIRPTAAAALKETVFPKSILRESDEWFTWTESSSDPTNDVLQKGNTETVNNEGDDLLQKSTMEETATERTNSTGIVVLPANSTAIQPTSEPEQRRRHVRSVEQRRRQGSSVERSVEQREPESEIACARRSYSQFSRPSVERRSERTSTAGRSHKDTVEDEGIPANEGPPRLVNEALPQRRSGEAPQSQSFHEDGTNHRNATSSTHSIGNASRENRTDSLKAYRNGSIVNGGSYSMHVDGNSSTIGSSSSAIQESERNTSQNPAGMNGAQNGKNSKKNQGNPLHGSVPNIHHNGVSNIQRHGSGGNIERHGSGSNMHHTASGANIHANNCSTRGTHSARPPGPVSTASSASTIASIRRPNIGNFSTNLGGKNALLTNLGESKGLSTNYISGRHTTAVGGGVAVPALGRTTPGMNPFGRIGQNFNAPFSALQAGG